MAQGDTRIFMAADAGRRRAEAIAWLGSRARSGALIVAPARGAADDLVRDGLAAGDGALGIHRFTPWQLAAALATPGLARSGRAPVSGLGAEALAARAVAACSEAGSLEYFAPVAATPGFSRALARTLHELRMEPVEPAALPDCGPPGEDLVRLHAAYAETLEARKLADEATLWQLAAAAAGDAAHDLVGLPLLLLDVPVRSRREADCYAALARVAPATLVTVVVGDPDTPGLLSRALEVEPESAPDDDLDGTTTGRLARLRRWVFAEGAPESPPESDVAEDDSLEFLSAPGEGRECVEIARRIQALAAAGVPFDHVAVLVRDPDDYLPLVEESLRRSGVPAYCTRGTIRPHPSGRAFLALLACAAEGLSASRFAEYLSLAQVPLLDDEGAPRLVEVPWVEPEGEQLVFKSLLPEGEAPVAAAGTGAAAGAGPDAGDRGPEAATDRSPVIAGTLQTPRRWEQLIVDAAVVGGRDRWRRRLAGLQAEFELRLRDLDEEDEGRRQQLLRQVVGVRNLERFALPVIEFLAGLPERAGWSEWLERLRRLSALTLRRPEQVLTVLAELEPMGPVGPVDLGEVRRVLEERLTFLRLEPADRRHGRVFVGTIDEARGRGFDTVFLPGLAEGIFPRRAAEDPLLLDERRAALEVPLTDQDRRVARERLLLRVAAGAAERRLVVSYPTLDALQGRARVPSFYALDVARAAEGRLPPTDELERRASSAAAPRIGWPAPRDPLRAVDAAEFDVATLAPLLTGARPEDRGRARYLVETNPALARSLRSRFKRWESSFCYADGLVSPDDAAMAALQEHRLEKRSYSPTALQSYAVCPYKFFLYAVQRLRPREEPAPLEQMDPLTRGSLFHEVQFLLFQDLREEGLLPVTPDNRTRVTERADAVLDTVADRYAEDLAPAIPRVWRDEIEGIRTDLRGWLRAVAEQDREWVPSFFEFSFGLGREPGRDPLSQHDEALVLDGYRLRGSIDLVEKRADGEVWRVTDHKTGRALRERFVVVGHGEVLQPLLYALAAEYHLGERVEAGRLFYCTRRGEYETREVALNTDTRAKVGQVLSFVDTAVEQGFLPAAPRERACQWCDFRTVCGPYEEIRIRRKERRSLVPLETLRNAP